MGFLLATTKQPVTVRKGPSLQFTVAAEMPNNTAALIIGKSADGKWFQMAYPDAAHPGWVAAAFVNVTGSADQLPVAVVALPATPTRAARTPAVPPPRGVLGFLAWDKSGASYALTNVVVDSRNIAGFKLIGSTPADVSLSTNAAPFAWAPDGSGRV